MRISNNLLALIAFTVAGLLAFLAAIWAVSVIENRSTAAIRSVLEDAGIEWAEVQADGLQVTLTGTAPTEATRFRALSLAGTVVDASRVVDAMEVTPANAIAAPRFSVEILRNDDGVSLIGLVPSTTDRETLVQEISGAAGGADVTDMLETANYTAPDGWDAALDYGMSAVKILPRSKISIAADRVAITALSDSEAEKRRLEADLARRKPDALTAAIDISAPRPVITPFTLRFVIDDAGPRFDACSADTERARDRIVAAAVAAGMTGKATCTIGLGVPSPSWAEAAEAGIAAVAEMGQGTITFSDADVSLIATVTTPQAAFDKAVGDLDAKLPEVFSLSATLPEKPKTVVEGPAEFTATLDKDGAVQLRGRLTDDTLRAAVDSYAKAQFGADRVYTATRLDDTLPDGWPVRVLAGLEAMAQLAQGTLLVREDTVEVSGVTGSQDAQSTIARILSNKLGNGKAFKVAVQYDERLDPLAGLPTPEECVADLNRVVTARKINFAPGSAEIDADAGDTLDELAETLKRCIDVRIEIGGHTDSQGSEGGNLALSQARAEAVLIALQGRRVPVGNISAKGYGETAPIADNGTEDGREANRRIEFKLIGTPEDEAAAQDAVTVTTTEAEASAETAAAEAEAAATEDAMAADAAARTGSGDTLDEGSGDGLDDGPGPDETSDAGEDPDDDWTSAAPQEKTQRPPRRPDNP